MQEELKGKEGDFSDILIYKLDSKIEMPVKNIQGNAYVGYLNIPAVSLKLPVMDEFSYDRLRTAPCRYHGTAYLPGFVICAHNYLSHFGHINELDKGDSLSFTDMDGNVFLYKVQRIDILKPDEISKMNTDAWDMTLFTCTVGGSKRVTVRCKRAESYM